MRNILPPLAPMSRRNHDAHDAYRPKFSTVYAAQFRAAPAWTVGKNSCCDSLGLVFAAALQALESIESTNLIGLGMAFRDGDGLSHGKPSFIEDEAMSEAVRLHA